jgi:DNA repair and recombination protein RAD54B
VFLPPPLLKRVLATSTQGPFKKFKPLLSKSIAVTKPTVAAPLFDSTASNALVVKGGVVVDPFISKNLRPHQRVGVSFLYSCLVEGGGVVLADSMGLGKTIQTISLIWTMLKQGGDNGKGLVKKVCIVCPATLINNWEKGTDLCLCTRI